MDIRPLLNHGMRIMEEHRREEERKRIEKKKRMRDRIYRREGCRGAHKDPPYGSKPRFP